MNEPNLWRGKMKKTSKGIVQTYTDGSRVYGKKKSYSSLKDVIRK